MRISNLESSWHISRTLELVLLSYRNSDSGALLIDKSLAVSGSTLCASG